MKTSIATVSISGDLSEKLKVIAKAGFDGVEIFENDFLTSDESPRQVGRMARDLGLEVTLFQPFRDFEGMPDLLRSRTFDRAERKFDLMQEIGTDLVLVCSNVSPAALGGLERAAADFHELGDRAARRGLRVGYEALAWGRHISDHRDAWEIVRRADHPSVGLILDSFHTLSRKIEINSIRSIPQEKLFIVQLADAPLFDMDLLYWSRHFRNMPGEGDLPVLDFMQAVVSTGYDGYFSLEIFNDQFRGGSAATIARDGWRSLIHLGDQVKREEPKTALSVPPMPARGIVEGVAFVEFAADSANGSRLEALLFSLGFNKIGKHKTRSAVLFRQGLINIVINTGREGFAGASYAVRGTSAYALGLLVDDAAAVVKRAVALGADQFSPAAGQHELEIPAVHGAGGGLLYFLDKKAGLDRAWADEFVSVDEPANPVSAGLTEVDHVAQTMRYEDLPTCLLFYMSLVESHKSAVVDVVDPSGIVRSQVVENSDGSLRITMNGAENQNTLAGRFVAENFGSGIQHIALQTEDIFSTAERLSQNGFPFLAISPNYYEDLEARLGLDPALTERLKANDILYDRDDGGEYFQIYSPTSAEGFFFEIVQRAGYKGYGASNAIFRIAALRKRLQPVGIPRR
ncbi:bifunctional sugar phosphate isomerase/epimerase/4-hydroxyphenylpyruvate dioxygenase family protein [Mesorhizobium qingshengii]|uniref:3-dehydroshikimate dehydratase n=1 Tax=Mesorhizobium qingshengii TaxID=1165689 RepID=A0A1G5ZAH2_9HYPH|nr:sugar phosphate isomerase/epimerase and 4-hydroxyphenylpyruvate domain-containing protein [Mesorhizobium qingshengii]SDA91567.1 4-hydroxyphenylpyruvate dioxygenase [Mesorhizobium qingshengii]